MATSFEALKRTWNVLGKEDPLWGVLSYHDKRGRRWQPAEFFQTGERDVERLYKVLLAHAAAKERFHHVLDFGCGVGRLALAWSLRAERVTGLDISPSMIAAGRQIIGTNANVELVLNASPDLGHWPDASFDLVFSYICLQHMPWPLAAGYLAEFARVCRPGQLVAFQLPVRQLSPSATAKLRHRLVNLLPFRLNEAYRRWRHGSHAIFEMFFTPAAVVQECAARVGLQLIHKESDPGAGAGTEGYFFIFRKPQTATSAPVAPETGSNS